jgi:hypothetical protein
MGESNGTYIDRDVFFCVCNTPSHNFCIWESIEDGKVDDICIEVHLDNFMPFYKRLWTAIKYLFKKIPRGCYDEVILEKPNVEKLVNALNKSLERM